MAPRLPFLLRGRSSVTRLRCIYSQCYALSRTFNPRNLEYHWYPSWNQHLFELIGNDPRLLIAPQFPLWISADLAVEAEGPADAEGGQEIEDIPDASGEPGVVEVDGSVASGDSSPSPGLLSPGIGRSPASAKNIGSAASRVEEWQKTIDSDAEDWDANIPFVTEGMEKAEDDEDDDDDENNINQDLHAITISTAATIARANAVLRVTDYAIIHVTPVESDLLPPRYQGYRIIDNSVPVLVEEKRYIDRSASGAEHDRLVNLKLQQAQTDLMFQAAILFRQYPNATVVTAISAAGPYWSSCEIEPIANNISDERFEMAMKTKRARIVRSTVQLRTLWSHAVRLDTPASTEKFQAIQDMLGELSSDSN